MASSIAPHNLTFPNPGLSKRQFCPPPPPPSLFPSHSLPKPSDSHSLFSRCHATSDSDSDSSDNSLSRRWDSAIQDLLTSAFQQFDSFFGPKQDEESIIDDEEWDWDRWKKHFEEVDEQERLVSILKAQLSRAVSREDYEDAGRLKVAIAAATRSDTVGRVMSYFNKAIKNERYGDAAFMRDDAGAGLVGWWAGTSKDSLDPYGIIIRITAEHGRYVARSYGPRQLAMAAGGVPLFEVFLQVNKKGEYKQQAVYLKRGEGLRDSPPNSSRLLSRMSNIGPLDSTEDNSDILVTSAEEEDDSDSIDNDSDLPNPEDMPGSQSIARDMIPGMKVKVLKVTAPSKVDRDLIARVIEQMIDEEDEDDDFGVEGLDTDDEDKGESDQEKDEVDMNAGPGVTESGGKNDFAVKVVVGGLAQKLSTNVPTKELLRFPAKLVKISHSSFSFTIDNDVSQQEHNGKKRASLDAEGKLGSRRSIDHVMLDLAKFIGGEKIPLKVLKDVGELISLTLSQAQNHRQLSGSTTFKRIEIPSNLDPLNGLYIGAHGIYTSEVIHLRQKFGQWQEDNQTKNQPNLEFYEYVEALKLIGDRYVPAGQVAFRAKIGKRYQLPHKGIIPEELGVIARYKGQGRLAEPGFQNPRWVDGELVILDGKYIKGGPVVGFVYWAPEYHFLVFFNRLRLQE